VSGALELRLRAEPDQHIDVSSLRPSNLRGRSLSEIERMTLSGERSDVAIGDVFAIQGDDPEHLVFTGDCSRLLRIGAGLDGGAITVEGNVGDYLACGMQSGIVDVHGNAADYAGAEMRAGNLRIRGHCGDFAGGALPGNLQGMRGGVLHIQGNAGARAADRMRRGLLLVEGDCGDFLGSRMLAGTALIKGKVGSSPGFALRRGTLMLWQSPEAIPANFNDCGRHTLGYLSLLQRALPPDCQTFSSLPTTVQRWCGDMAEGGYGELLHP